MKGMVAVRRQDGNDALTQYKSDRDFEKFNLEMNRLPLNDTAQIDVFYDPGLTC